MAASERNVGGRRILVAVVGAPHGVKGEIRIKSHMQVPTAIGNRAVFTAPSGGEEMRIMGVRALKEDMVIGRIAGVETREAAAALTGRRLFIGRDALPPADEDEFYHADLVGLSVRTTAGQPVGAVIAVVNYGGGDLLEVGTGETDTVLVPFLKCFVPIVDLAGGALMITPEALAGDEDEDAAGTAAP
jgi:16S rRNA processing protein RimM